MVGGGVPHGCRGDEVWRSPCSRPSGEVCDDAELVKFIHIHAEAEASAGACCWCALYNTHTAG